MDEKTKKQMAKMVDALQPHCDEQIIAAMTCSHAGSMSSGLLSKFLGGLGGNTQSVNLPNPVFIAVGTKSIYAFDYAPRELTSRSRRKLRAGLKMKFVWNLKILARWPLLLWQLNQERVTPLKFQP